MASAAFLLATDPSLAQQAARPAEPDTPNGAPLASFEDQIDVRVLELEVVVTDQRGEPVAGLQREDFRVLVQGQPTEIENFQERHLALRQANEPSPGEPDESRAPAQVAEIGTSFLVFIDQLSIPLQERQATLRLLSNDEDLLGPRDRMGVVAYGGRKFQVLSPWSEDGDALRAMFAAAADKKGPLVEDGEVELSTALRWGKGPTQTGGTVGSNVVGTGRGDPGSSSLQDTRWLIQMDQQRQVERSVSAASAVLHAFADTPGRKVLLLMARGWAYSLDSPKHTLAGANPLWSLIENANALGFTVYPLHTARVGGPGPSTHNPASRLQLDSLADLAEHTGGEVVRAGGRHPTAKIRQQGKVYYSLGVSSDRPSNERREVQVEVLRPGMQVRSRRSLLHLPRAELLARGTEARTRLDLAPAETDTALARNSTLSLEVGEPQRAGRGLMDVPMVLHIPVEPWQVLDLGDRSQLRLHLRIASVDRRGRSSEAASLPVQLEFRQKPQVSDGPLKFDLPLRLRRTPQKLRFELSDEATGAMLVATVDVAP